MIFKTKITRSHSLRYDYENEGSIFSRVVTYTFGDLDKDAPLFLFCSLTRFTFENRDAMPQSSSRITLHKRIFYMLRGCFESKPKKQTTTLVTLLEARFRGHGKYASSDWLLFRDCWNTPVESALVTPSPSPK